MLSIQLGFIHIKLQTVSMDQVATYWTYWFMFPLSIVIATVAMTFGIGGAAFFSPTFAILFPLLNVPTLSASEAFGASLFTEMFGFASGWWITFT